MLNFSKGKPKFNQKQFLFIKSSLIGLIRLSCMCKFDRFSDILARFPVLSLSVDEFLLISIDDDESLLSKQKLSNSRNCEKIFIKIKDKNFISN